MDRLKISYTKEEALGVRVGVARGNGHGRSRFATPRGQLAAVDVPAHAGVAPNGAHGNAHVPAQRHLVASRRDWQRVRKRKRERERGKGEREQKSWFAFALAVKHPFPFSLFDRDAEPTKLYKALPGCQKQKPQPPPDKKRQE
jgi:hypothetical protein